MIWVLVDVALGLLALIVLAIVGLVLYGHTRTLLRTVSATSATVSKAIPDTRR